MVEPVKIGPQLASFPFLELPIDLRMLVYGHLIEEISVLHPEHCGPKACDECGTKRTLLLPIKSHHQLQVSHVFTCGILSTSRQVHAEAKTIYRHVLRSRGTMLVDFWKGSEHSLSDIFRKHHLQDGDVRNIAEIYVYYVLGRHRDDWSVELSLSSHQEDLDHFKDFSSSLATEISRMPALKLMILELGVVYEPHTIWDYTMMAWLSKEDFKIFMDALKPLEELKPFEGIFVYGFCCYEDLIGSSLEANVVKRAFSASLSSPVLNFWSLFSMHVCLPCWLSRENPCNS